jgi:hypothetical protein
MAEQVMAVRQQPVQFVGIVANHFQHFHSHGIIHGSEGDMKLKLKLKLFTASRQTGPEAIYRANLLSHSGLISKLGPRVFSTMYTYRHT